MEDSFLASEQSDKEQQARMRQMDAEIASIYTFPSPSQPLQKLRPYEDFESGIENEEEKSEECKFENEEEEVVRVEEEEKEEEMSEQESGDEKNEEVEGEKEREMRIEKERERIQIPNIEPPRPYPREITTEDTTLIQLINDYVASCNQGELWGKEAHEEEKESEQVHVLEIKEELLNTPLEVVEVPIEIMSASVDRDPSEVSRYGRQHQDSRKRHTKKPGKGNEGRRKTLKLLLFPSYFKSRWRDTFDGLHTISGIVLGICAKRGLLVEAKDDLRPP